MNESEWVASEDPAAMLAYLRGEVSCGNPPQWREGLVSDRKLRLWVEACRSFVPLSSSDPLLSWASIDHAVGLDEALRFWSPARYFAYEEHCPATFRAALLRDIVGNPFRPVTLPKDVKAKCKWCDGRGWRANTSNSGPDYLSCGCDKGGVGVSCSWLTPAVLSLAYAAYEERMPDGTLDPARLAVLSDALEEAGCEDDLLLRHLRGYEPCQCYYGYGPPPGRPQCSGGFRPTGPHVRGCWAVDLVLGLG